MLPRATPPRGPLSGAPPGPASYNLHSCDPYAYFRAGVPAALRGRGSISTGGMSSKPMRSILRIVGGGVDEPPRDSTPLVAFLSSEPGGAEHDPERLAERDVAPSWCASSGIKLEALLAARLECARMVGLELSVGNVHQLREVPSVGRCSATRPMREPAAPPPSAAPFLR